MCPVGTVLLGSKLIDDNALTPKQREILATGRAALDRELAASKVVPFATFSRRRSKRNQGGSK